MGFLLAPENGPFSICLSLMLMLGLLEAIAMTMGAALSDALQNFFHIPHIDHDAPDGAFESVLGWLHLGRVPIMILIALMLGGFAIGGFVVQYLAKVVAGGYLPAWIASIPALVSSVGLTRVAGGGIARIMPKDETSSVSESSLVGRTATITIGTAKRGAPAEARLRDQHGQAHYVMVEPDVPDEEFPQGTSVLLVGQLGVVYRCLRDPDAST